MIAQLNGVDPVNLRDYITLTMVLGAAVLSLLNYLRARKAPEPVVAESRPREFVDRAVCSTVHVETDHRIKRLEIAEAAMRVELADIRREMKEDREGIQRMIREEFGKVHSRVNDVFIAVAELRGASKSDPFGGRKP